MIARVQPLRVGAVQLLRTYFELSYISLDPFPPHVLASKLLAGTYFKCCVTSFALSLSTSTPAIRAFLLTFATFTLPSNGLSSVSLAKASHVGASFMLHTNNGAYCPQYPNILVEIVTCHQTMRKGRAKSKRTCRGGERRIKI